MAFDDRNWLNKFLRSVVSEFKHQPLGATYYLFMVLVGLSGGVGWLRTLFVQDSEYLPYIQGALYLLITGTIITVPLMLWKLLATRNVGPPALNPNLESLATTFEVEAWETGRTVIRKDRLKAVALSKQFVYRFRPTGSVSMKVNLLEPRSARLTGPVHHHDYILYQIEFNDPIETNQVVDVSLSYEIEDPNCTMKPFHSVVAANLCRFGSLANVIRFRDGQPDGVAFEITDGRTGALVEERIGSLFPDEQGVYSWRVAKVSTTNVYRISWRWHS